MKSIRTTIIVFSIILAELKAFNWYIFYESGINNIPEFIPFTPIKINGLLLTSYTILISIVAAKKIYKIESGISIAKVTL
jgi:hypothetical protein